MTTIYECSNCGVISETGDHLCSPHTLSEKTEYCGTNPDRDICDTMQRELPFECGTCGRGAEDKELLCNPHKIN